MANVWSCRYIPLFEGVGGGIILLDIVISLQRETWVATTIRLSASKIC